MGYGGPLVPVSLRKVVFLSGPVVAASCIPPLDSPDSTNEMTGGGDVHRSSPQPSFSSKGFYVRAAAVP